MSIEKIEEDEKLLQGMLVFHPKLGVGIVQQDIPFGVWVSWLFMSPNTLTDKSILKKLIPNDVMKRTVYSVLTEGLM